MTAFLALAYYVIHNIITILKQDRPFVQTCSNRMHNKDYYNFVAQAHEIIHLEKVKCILVFRP